MINTTNEKNNLYELHSFIRFYFSASGEINNNVNEESENELLKYIAKTRTGEIPVNFEETERLITLLMRTQRADEQRVKQYCYIKKFLAQNGMEDLFRSIFELIFEIFKEGAINASVIKSLLDNYGRRIAYVLKDKTREEVISSIEQYALLKRQLVLISVLKTPTDDVCTLQNDLTDELPESFIFEEDENEDDSIELTNMVIELETDMYDKMKKVNTLPWYCTDEDEECAYIGNMITLADKGSERKVTYQIIERTEYTSYNEMFSKRKPASFGFGDMSAEELTDKFLKLFGKMQITENCLALSVIDVSKSFNG
ncbi:MAG: hypothetical protein KBS52_04835 [Clostridiales bacterium]|nr:hypothetical protein [Candidatus Equinaster intestinalis]